MDRSMLLRFYGKIEDLIVLDEPNFIPRKKRFFIDSRELICSTKLAQKIVERSQVKLNERSVHCIARAITSKMISVLTR